MDNGNVRFLHTKGSPTITQDAWVIDLRKTLKKRRSIMNLFKKKKKRVGYGNNEITEQKYVDMKFKNLEESVDHLCEKTEILDLLSGERFLLINGGLYVGEGEKRKYLNEVQARKWAKENGYSYTESFKHHGELWIKETKEK